MGNYDEIEFSATFNYREWQLLAHCVSKRRDESHDRADYLELNEFKDSTPEIAGLRRKAAEMFDLLEDIKGLLARCRQDNPVSP